MYVTVNDVRLYYECLGQGEEILLIPGNGTSIKYMMRLARLLANEYKVYLIDRRGQGKSTKKCDLSYELNVQDVYCFIQKLNILKPYIIGHSGGAVIATMFCLKYKDIASKLVLCSGALSIDSVSPKQIKNWKLCAKYHIINPKIIKMILEQPNLTDMLKEINIDILVLAPDKDIINKEHTQTIATSIQKSKLIMYENYNHSSYITRAVCYNDIISFLKGDNHGK